MSLSPKADSDADVLVERYTRQLEIPEIYRKYPENCPDAYHPPSLPLNCKGRTKAGLFAYSVGLRCKEDPPFDLGKDPPKAEKESTSIAVHPRQKESASTRNRCARRVICSGCEGWRKGPP